MERPIDDGLPTWRLVQKPCTLDEPPQGGARPVFASHGLPARPRQTAIPIPKPAERIRLVGTTDPLRPVPIGTPGTAGLRITRLGPAPFHVMVDWDNGQRHPLTEHDTWQPASVEPGS